MSKRVLVFCAHSDDQVIGAGGYIAKLTKEGVKVKTIICSFGEKSQPHMNIKEIKKIRVLESKKADRILGSHGVMFIGLHEGNFEKDYAERKLHASILRHIQEFRPDVILTHSSDDPHPDHRACHNILLSIHKYLPASTNVYVFDVWNFFNLHKRRKPKLVIDITETFKRKIDAVGTFKSQMHAIAVLIWSIYIKAIFWGWRRGCRYAEVYYRVR